MASEKKFLSLDLGMQSLRLAEFSLAANGNLKLLRGARRELLIDPSLDPSRPDQVGLALADILKSWKLKSSKVSCVLPAHSVFTRVVPLDVPGGISGLVDAVARFEAQQNIPFPLEEVVWDYVVMGELPSGAVTVVFLAIKTDLLESLCSSITHQGLKIYSVTTAPIALYDSFIFGRKDACHQPPSLLLDLGSRTTNMVIAGSGSFFCRSIPSGGLAVTAAIAKDIHATLEESEHLKISRGSVGLGPGFEPPTDPVDANLAKITRQTLIKTQTDIARSLGYYRTNLGGDDPLLILLSGGMASMPYLAEFIQEKFQKETSFFDPLAKISLSPKATSFAEANTGNLGELIGGALQFTPGGSHTPINLLPSSVAKKQAFVKKLPALAAAACLFILSLVAWGIYGSSAAQATRHETEKITLESKQMMDISQKIQTLLQKQTEIRKTSADLLSIVQLRDIYPKIVAELASKVPDRFLWITEVQAATDPAQKGSTVKSTDTLLKAVIVKGLYLDNPRQASVIDDFVMNLQSSDLFAVDEKEKSKLITQRSSPSGEFWAYPFTLRVPLRNPIPSKLP
jgi:type IV pilus assembly protein PilM